MTSFAGRFGVFFSVYSVHPIQPPKHLLMLKLPHLLKTNFALCWPFSGQVLGKLLLGVRKSILRCCLTSSYLSLHDLIKRSTYPPSWFYKQEQANNFRLSYQKPHALSVLEISTCVTPDTAHDRLITSSSYTLCLSIPPSNPYHPLPIATQACMCQSLSSLFLLHFP